MIYLIQVGWFPASYVKLLTSSGTASGRTTPTAKFRDTPSPMFGKGKILFIILHLCISGESLLEFLEISQPDFAYLLMIVN